jgi:ComF family protein
MSSQPAGKSLCPTCQAALPLYQAARSYTIFGGAIRNAIHRFKYRQDLGLGEALSHMLIEKLQQLDWPVDLIAPVPLSPARQRERGYNQSGLLARPIGYYFGISYAPNALCRTRETRSQVGLNAVERSINLANAFSADPKLVSGHTVLVIDDVMTTGATLANCTKALLDAGANQVYGLALARAVIHQDGFENKTGIGIA